MEKNEKGKHLTAQSSFLPLISVDNRIYKIVILHFQVDLRISGWKFFIGE